MIRSLATVSCVANCTLAGCVYHALAPEDIIWELREEVDEGFLCLSTEEDPSIATLGVEPQLFEANRPLKLHYDAARCFTDWCDRNFEVEASGTLEPDKTMALQTTLRWELAPWQEGLACDSTCYQLDKVFHLEPLPEDGTYTLAWGDQEITFEVPSEDIVCLGTRVPGESDDRGFLEQ